MTLVTCKLLGWLSDDHRVIAAIKAEINANTKEKIPVTRFATIVYAHILPLLRDLSKNLR